MLCLGRERFHSFLEGTMSESVKVTERILRSALSIECNAVGPAVVTAVVHQQPMTAPSEGRRVDLGALMDLLAAAVTFINGVLELRKRLKASQGRVPTEQELSAAAQADSLPTGPL